MPVILTLMMQSGLLAQNPLTWQDLIRQAQESRLQQAKKGKDKRTVERRNLNVYVPANRRASELVIIGRDPTSFRRPGTLLAQATTRIPTLDEDELRQRQHAFYEGKRFSHHPAFSEEYLAFAEAGVSSVRSIAQAEEKSDRAWLWWGVFIAMGLVILVLWRKGYLTREAVGY